MAADCILCLGRNLPSEEYVVSSIVRFFSIFIRFIPTITSGLNPFSLGNFRAFILTASVAILINTQQVLEETEP